MLDTIDGLEDEVLGDAAASNSSNVAWPSIFCCDLASCRDFISSVELTDEELAPEISIQCSLILVAEYKKGQNHPHQNFIDNLKQIFSYAGHYSNSQ